MQTLEVTNVYSSPYGVNTVEGTVTIEPGKSLTADFSDGEARNLVGNKAVFKVKGYVEPTAADVAEGNRDAGKDGTVDLANLTAERDDLSRFKSSVAPIANRLKIGDAAAFNSTVSEALDRGDAALADIEAIKKALGIGPNDSIFDAIDGLKAQVAKFDGDGNGSTGGSGKSGEPMTLADAVKSLDDKNDAHWIGSGKPNLDVLGGLTKSTPTRAEVDALGRVRKVS